MFNYYNHLMASLRMKPTLIERETRKENGLEDILEPLNQRTLKSLLPWL